MNKSFKLRVSFKLIIIGLMCLYFQHTQAQTTDRILMKDSTILYVNIKKTTEDSVFFKYYGQHPDSISSMPLSNIHQILKRKGAVVNYSKEALDSAKAKGFMAFWDSAKVKIGFIPFYVDASVGFGLGALTERSAGIRWNSKNAIGVSKLYWNTLSNCCFTDANGIGGQWRFTPNKKIFTKFEVGYIKAAHYGDDGPYRAVYNYQKSNKIYQRLTVARSFSVLTVGLTIIRANGQINDNFDYQTHKYLRSSVFNVNVVVLNLGLAIPHFYKTNPLNL